MDERVQRFKTPEECERFARNVIDKYPNLAQEARRRSVELRASAHGALTAVEAEALKAVYAYEEVLTAKHGRRIRASRTWPMIERRGIIGAVEEIVKRRKETTGYLALVGMGLQDLAFEAVVLRYPESFSKEAIERSTQRLKAWTSGSQN